MKKLNIILIVALIAFIASSCSKDFLEVEPVGKVSTDSYYQTDEEAQLALIAAYDFLHSDQFEGWSSPFFIKNLPSDESNCGGGGPDDQPQYQAIDDFKWEPSNAGITSFYKMNYFGITRCNLIISKVSPETEIRERVIAEAKFLRAYFYFDLVSTFGNVPLVIEPAETGNDANPRAPKADVYTQIEKDLTEAAAVLPNKSEYSVDDSFRASKQTAQALLGKAHLYQEEYADALTALELVIATEDSEVRLTPDFSEIFLVSNEFGMESLLEASFISEGKNWGNAGWDRTADDNRHLQLWGPRDYNDANDILGIGLIGGWGFNPATRKLHNTLDDNDPRKALTTFDYTAVYVGLADSLYSALQVEAVDSSMSFNDYLIHIGVDSTTVVDGTVDEVKAASVATVLGLSYAANAHDVEGIIRLKYATRDGETSGEVRELNYTTNWRLIRYADVLLMAAEAALNSDPGKALDYVNRVRGRAGADPLVGTVTFDDIVYERQAELALEGCRFWDLVRWGLANQELSDLGFVAGKHEVFPIPKSEIENNPGITVADQNPGY